MVATDHTDMASGPLMPMPTTAMAAMAHTATARGLLMPRLTTAMAATAHTAMARGLLMPMLTTAMLATVDPMVMESALLMLTTDMAAMAHTYMASKLRTYTTKREDTSGINQIYPIPKVPRTDMIREFCNLLNKTKINFYTNW